MSAVPLTAPVSHSVDGRCAWYLRYGLAAVSLALATWAGVQFYWAVHNSADLNAAESIETLHYTEPVKAAAAQKIEAAKGLFQVSMLTVAVLWGLVIAKRDERVMLLSDKPEVLMFILANALFVSTAICYSIYSDRMATVLTLGADRYDDPKDLTILNYRDPLIESVYERLTYVWGAAMIVTGLVLLSAHGLKPAPVKDNATCAPSA